MTELERCLRDDARRAAYEAIQQYLSGKWANGEVVGLATGEVAGLAVEFLKVEAAIRQIEEMARYGPTTAPVPTPR